MRKEEFFAVLGELDGELVEEAGKTEGKRTAGKRAWIKWGAAACLCLAALGTAVLFRGSSEGGSVSGGDPVGDSGGAMYSVAVYPGSEREEDVASADVNGLTEEEALDSALAEHLPGRLPEGFHYGRGSLYQTVMKDGTRYRMLRVEYISGSIPEQRFSEDGGAIAPDPETIGETFVVCVTDYEPETSITRVSSREEASLALLEENGAAWFRAGDCFVGVFTETAEPETVWEALQGAG